jgi:post-segregation antitoxin (ccd killing protein)
MRMARVNIYLPDELAEEARAAGLNVSALTQDAVRRALSTDQLEEWLGRVARLPATRVAHEHVVAAIDGAREELGRFGA